MADSLTCKIVTPAKTVFSESASYVALPGEAGGFGVMKGHEPLVSGLGSGVVRITTSAAGKSSEVKFVVSGGYAEIKDDEVIVLADNAQSFDDVDVEAVRAELEGVEAQLSDIADGDAQKEYYLGQKAWLELLIASVTQAQ